MVSGRRRKRGRGGEEGWKKGRKEGNSFTNKGHLRGARNGSAHFQNNEQSGFITSKDKIPVVEWALGPIGPRRHQALKGEEHKADSTGNEVDMQETGKLSQPPRGRNKSRALGWESPCRIYRQYEAESMWLSN